MTEVLNAPDRIVGLLRNGLHLDTDVRSLLVKSYNDAREALEAQDKSSASEEVTGGDQDEDVKQACKQASLMFVAKGLHAASSGKATNSGLPISRIVATAGINVLDFFKEIHVVVSKLSGYFEANNCSSKQFTAQTHLKEWSETVVVMGLLAKKYKDFFNAFLHQLDFYKQVVLRLGWVLFLVLKSKLLCNFPDIISCVELLPCVFTLLVSHAPKMPDCLRGLETKQPTNILKTISDICKTDYSHVSQTMVRVEALLSQYLPTAVPRWRTAAAAATGTSVYEGLVSDLQSMNQVVALLEREYELHYLRHGELDERDFLALDFGKFTSPRQSPAPSPSSCPAVCQASIRPGALLGPGAHTTAPGPASTPSPFLAMAPGLHSPLPLMHLAGAPGTPVSEAMGAAAWLRGLTLALPAEPSPALAATFLAMNPDPGPAISRRVKEMVAAVIADDHMAAQPFPLMQPSLASERRTEIVKLYYHVLEVIVVSEQRSGLSPQGLLASLKFHRGLLACCVEVVAACYRMVSCAFPKVLDALRLKAFDLAKMLMSFVKSMTTLPRELKRHLFLIEEKIIESLAWEPGSSLYPLIMAVVAEREGAADTAEQPGEDVVMATSEPCATPGPPASPKRSSASAFSHLMSPAKKARGTDSSGLVTVAFNEPIPLAVGPPPANAAEAASLSGCAVVLHDFMRKVLKLAAFRLALLCNNFDFSPLEKAEVNQKVYETLEYGLYHQTHMYYNRHVDQIVLSALYGYCKVHKLNQVSFREIISQYRKQPQSQQQVFRSVVIEQSNPGLQVTQRLDIIAFYNHVFVPAMKSFLLRSEAAAVAGAGAAAAPPAPTLGGGGAGQPTGLPPLPPSRDSPMKTQHLKAPISSTKPPRPPGSILSNIRTAPHTQPALPQPQQQSSPASATLSAGLLQPFGTLEAALMAGKGEPAPTQASQAKSAKGTKPSEQPKIPGGLAALLQALDSQVGGEGTAGGPHDSQTLPGGATALGRGPPPAEAKAASAPCPATSARCSASASPGVTPHPHPQEGTDTGQAQAGEANKTSSSETDGRSDLPSDGDGMDVEPGRGSQRSAALQRKAAVVAGSPQGSPGTGRAQRQRTPTKRGQA